MNRYCTSVLIGIGRGKKEIRYKSGLIAIAKKWNFPEQLILAIRYHHEPTQAPAAARDAASTWGHVVVLKGACTVVASPDGSAAVSTFENPALATGGTGDVLAGTIGGLLAQGLAPNAAARLGVHLHGMAGEAVRHRVGDAGLVAGDLPFEIARARHRLVADAARRAGAGTLDFGRPAG